MEWRGKQDGRVKGAFSSATACTDTVHDLLRMRHIANEAK